MPKRDPNQLTEKEQAFVAALMRLGNATEAHIAAGYAGNRVTAGVNAGRLLKRPRVKAAVEAARASALEKAEVDAAEAFRRISVIAGFDPASLYNEKGELVPVWKLPADVRRVIKDVKPDGSYKLMDVQRALEVIAEAGGRIKKAAATVEAMLTFNHLGYLQEMHAEYQASLKVKVTK